MIKCKIIDLYQAGLNFVFIFGCRFFWGFGIIVINMRAFYNEIYFALVFTVSINFIFFLSNWENYRNLRANWKRKYFKGISTVGGQKSIKTC